MATELRCAGFVRISSSFFLQASLPTLFLFVPACVGPARAGEKCEMEASREGFSLLGSSRLSHFSTFGVCSHPRALSFAPLLQQVNVWRIDFLLSLVLPTCCCGQPSRKPWTRPLPPSGVRVPSRRLSTSMLSTQSECSRRHDKVQGWTLRAVVQLVTHWHAHLER